MNLHAVSDPSGPWRYDQEAGGFANASPGPSMPAPGESGYDPLLIPGLTKAAEELFGVIDTAIKGPTVFRLEARAKIEAEKSKQAQWAAMAAMATQKQGGFRLTPMTLLIGGGAAILLVALLARGKKGA